MASPSHHRYSSAARWQLGAAPVLGLAIFVSAFVLLAIAAFLYAHLRSPQKQVDAPLAFAANSMRIICILMIAIGVACYILVSERAPRPRQLHAHGVVLVLMLPDIGGMMLAEMLDREGHWAGWAMFVFGYLAFGVRKVLFFMLLLQKLIVLGRLPEPWLGIRLWGRVLIASTLMAVSGGVAGWTLCLSLLLRGASREDPLALAACQPNVANVSIADKIVMRLCIICSGVGSVGYLVSGSLVMLIARRLIYKALAELAERHVTGELLAKVRRTLEQHLWGVMVSTISTHLIIIFTIVDACNLIGQEDLEDTLAAAVSVVESAGDVAGILLLSGMGVLLFQEDPEAGDINGHIRGLLRAAVLTGRADVVFEGHVAMTPSRCCIVSFPGKFLEEWKALTWLCKQGELSSACVFLPTSDPKKRFGKHVTCPETPDRCWCHSLYGEVKPWGCLWFVAWKDNIAKAIELDLDLVVVFHPGQVGRGEVDWADLGLADLWDGVGLGGSQKAEAAYLKKIGLQFIAEDLEDARRRITER